LDGNVVTLSPEDDITCTLTNDDTFGKVIVTKYNDHNGNGIKDENDEVLSDWDIILSQYKQTTGENGKVSFDPLLPGVYGLSENLQEGWRQTNISCDIDSEKSNELVDNSVYSINLQPEQTVNCYIGNQRILPKISISKYNNRWPNAITAGSDVLYTLILKVTENNIRGVTVTDLPPLGFKYKSGSYQVLVNGVSRNIPEPAYHSPGKWFVGDLEKGDVVTLSYLATVDTSIDAGLYKDIAWAYGCSESSSCSMQSEDKLLAYSTDSGQSDSGVLTGTFVGSKVKLDPIFASQDVNVVREEGQVLGATTEMPSTGADTIWLYLSLMLSTLGTGLITSGLKKGKKI
jgi:hypothetical protein